MALPVSVPYAFANATTTQNLSYLDSNFNALVNGLNGLANGASQISISSISATGNANATTYLRGDGSWSTVSGGGGNGTVTSVNANSTVSGFTFTNGPVTTSGTLTLTGPSPGASGNVLTSNGSAWISGTVSVPQGAKAWLSYNGGTQTINSSYNISSVTRNGVGDYTINMATALATSTYAVVGLSGTAPSYSSGYLVETVDSVTARTTTLFRIYTFNTAGTNSDAGNLQLAVFGN